jgi:hypothetical protein
VVERHRPREEVSATGSGTPRERRWRSDGWQPVTGTMDGRGVRGGHDGDCAAGVGEDEGGGDRGRRRGRRRKVGGDSGGVCVCVCECVCLSVWCVSVKCLLCLKCVTIGPMETCRELDLGLTAKPRWSHTSAATT